MMVDWHLKVNFGLNPFKGTNIANYSTLKYDFHPMYFLIGDWVSSEQMLHAGFEEQKTDIAKMAKRHHDERSFGCECVASPVRGKSCSRESTTTTRFQVFWGGGNLGAAKTNKSPYPEISLLLVVEHDLRSPSCATSKDDGTLKNDDSFSTSEMNKKQGNCKKTHHAKSANTDTWDLETIIKTSAYSYKIF